MSRRNLWELHECHEAVIRYGVDEPCDKTAVALRIDPEEGHPYPVCARHSRNGGSRMVPLADVVRPVVEELDRIAAAHDAAVARAEQAEQAVARVREEIVEQVIEAIKVRREHHIACGSDLRHTAGMYETIRIVQELAKEDAP